MISVCVSVPRFACQLGLAFKLLIFEWLRLLLVHKSCLKGYVSHPFVNMVCCSFCLLNEPFWIGTGFWVEIFLAFGSYKYLRSTLCFRCWIRDAQLYYMQVSSWMVQMESNLSKGGSLVDDINKRCSVFIQVSCCLLLSYWV